jgi:hypothetical protein
VVPDNIHDFFVAFAIGHEVTALVRGQHDEPADEDKPA